MSKTVSYRYNWIDFTRGIGILLVLLGHNNPPFIRYIFGFHMPLFFILSGFLFKNPLTEASSLSVHQGRISQINYLKNIGTYCSKLLKSYLIPYWGLSLVNLVLHSIHLKYVTATFPSQTDIFRYIKGILIVDCDNMPCCGQLWFLPALAMGLFVFYLLQSIPLIWIRTIVILSCGGLCIFLQNHILPFRLHTVPFAVIFLEIGYLTKKLSLIDIINNGKTINICKIRLLTCSLILLALGIIAIKYNPVNPWVDMNDARFGMLPLTIVGATFTSIGVILITVMFDRCPPIIYLGRHTVFLLAFDFASNSWGGTIIEKHLLLDTITWYEAFAIRFMLLVAAYGIYLIARFAVKLFYKTTRISSHR